MIRIRSRKSWHPRPPKTPHVPVSTEGRTVRVHHTAGPRPHPAKRGRGAMIAAEKQLIRDTQDQHMDANGWSDIGYSVGIMPSGRVWALRGIGVLGAHTLDHNEDVGVVFFGNYETTKPTRRSLVAFWRLRRRLRRQYGVSVRVRPHCATYATACPGKFLRKALNL